MADSDAAHLLLAWIARQATPDAMVWFADKRNDLARDPSDRRLGAAFSMVPRRMGRTTLVIEAADHAAADRARPGWTPLGVTIDQAARILLLLDTAGHGPEPFAPRLQGLAATADLGELVAIYKGLPLYPDPAGLTPLATDGLRTAMRVVFEAVAHHNPFPAEQFPQAAWNHMVLKALFIDSVLHPIVGLDRRWNQDLARTLCDYAHERWAAQRPVTPELWRGVGRFADDGAIADLARVLTAGTPAEQIAAALALSESPHSGAAPALQARPDLAAQAASGRITWRDVCGEPTPA